MAVYYWRGSTQGTHGIGISADGATGSSHAIYGSSGQLANSGTTGRQFWSQFGWNVPGNWLVRESAFGGSMEFEGFRYSRTTAIPGGGDHVRFARLTLPLDGPGASGGDTGAAAGFESIPHTPLLWGGWWNKPGSGTTHEMGWLYAGNTSDKLKTVRVEPSYGTGVIYHNSTHNHLPETNRGSSSVHFDNHFGHIFGLEYYPIGSTGHGEETVVNSPDGMYRNFGAWGHVGVAAYALQNRLLEKSLGGSTNEFGGFSGGVTGWINVGVTAGHNSHPYGLPGARCLGLVVNAEKFLGVPDKATSFTFVDSQFDAVYASGSQFRLLGGTYGEVHAMTPINESPTSQPYLEIGDFTAGFAQDSSRTGKVNITTLLDIHTGSYYDPEYPSFTKSISDGRGLDRGLWTIKSNSTIANVVVTAPARTRRLRIDANVTTAAIYPQCRRAVGLNDRMDTFSGSATPGSPLSRKFNDRYFSVDFVASGPSVVPGIITNLTLHDENPTTGIAANLRGVFREGEILSDTELYAPGTTASYTNRSGLKGVNNIVGLDASGNVQVGNLFIDGGRLILGSVTVYGAGITKGNLGPDGYGMHLSASGYTYGGMQTAEYSSEDNVLIKLGELNTDGHIDGRHPDDPNWKAFKIGAGASLPADGGGIKVIGEKVDIDLVQGTRFVADYDSALGSTSGTTTPVVSSGKPGAIKGVGSSPKG